jgi:hypothetical protein
MRRKSDFFGMLSIILQDLALEIQQKSGKMFDIPLLFILPKKIFHQSKKIFHQ